MTGLADVTAGLLPGWHNRCRAWWGDVDEGTPTLLSLGICDVTGIVRGEDTAFIEMFRASPGSAHVVFVPDHPVAPSARIVLEQLVRTPRQADAIAGDLKAHLAAAGAGSSPADWMFAGAFLSSLAPSPIVEWHSVLTARGAMQLGAPDLTLMSLTAEPQTLLRHKTLDYSLNILLHHQAAAGPAIQNWLSSSFEAVHRTPQDIREDYRSLVDAIAAATGGRLAILNRMSTLGSEDISIYAGFDAPLRDTLANIASKELNLMLHDLAEERDVVIIDVDALAAEFGGCRHLPDGMHQSGQLQEALRLEVLAALESCRRAQERDARTAVA